MEYLIIFVVVFLCASRLSTMVTGHSLGYNIQSHWRKSRTSATTDSGLVYHKDKIPELPPIEGVMSQAQWLERLEDAPHLLIYGPSKAGKSTLAQAVVGLLGDCDYVVIDPQPNKPSERKWGAANFITLDEHGDEYGSIKVALERIEQEDKTRRQTQRTKVHPPLIVIIDEVLALVDGLGVVTNEENKKEPRMSRFIRRMGYSARHRNIKIILIGQGKNLSDLGLSSATARNNYALVRCARNAATNERAAYILHDDGEQPMDIRDVSRLASRAASRARLWLRHEDMIIDAMDEGGSTEPVPTKNTDSGWFHGGTGTDTVVVPPDTRAVSDDMLIGILVDRGLSANDIYGVVGGNRARVLSKIKLIRGEP